MKHATVLGRMVDLSGLTALTLAGTLCTALLALAPPAHAINCSMASNTVERLICGNTELRSADAAMGRAYRAILGATDDAEIRHMLMESQKRWIKKRDLRLADTFNANDTGDKPSKAVLLANLLAAMHDRTDALTAPSKSDPKVPNLIETALQQRRFSAQYTSGPFAGYESDCDFFPSDQNDPGPYSYSCFARRVYQNKNRVCSAEMSWATYRVYENDEIAEVVDGKLKTIATCSDTDGACPDDDDANGQWNLNRGQTADTASGPGTSSPPPQRLPKIDSDAGPDDNAPWLHACLTDSAYPGAPVAGAGSGAAPH